MFSAGVVSVVQISSSIWLSYFFRLDHDKFYPEAHRILKPGGCLAAWGYDLLTFPDNQEAQELLHKLFSVTLGPYWHPRVDHVWQHYKGGWWAV